MWCLLHKHNIESCNTWRRCSSAFAANKTLTNKEVKQASKQANNKQTKQDKQTK